MQAREEVLSWRGHQLRDRNGDKVGEIQEIYLDSDTDQAEWALVKTGLFGGKATFVPLRDATSEEGEVTVPFEKAQIKDAPSVDPRRPALAAGGG